MLKAIKIRLYLNDEQNQYVANLLGCSRFIYNNCLAYKINKYNNEKYSVSFTELGKYLTNLKTEYTWLKDVHSKVLQQSLIDLNDSYKRFFKNGTGFPNFKSKHSNNQSCRFPIDAIGKIKGNRITIINQLKNIHYKCSKRDEILLNKYQDNIRSGTLRKTKTNKFYFSILLDLPETTNKLLPETTHIVGIDLGIKEFVITSDGELFDNIKIKRNNEKKLKRLHKKLSKKQKGSKNKEKARIKLAKYYEKLGNIKRHYLHQISNSLLNENQVIVMEDLNVKGMMKNHNLAISIQELSLSEFKSILKYKAAWYKRDIVEINRFFPSSKLCSICGYKNKELILGNREWTCPECNTHHDRDFNAAVNILNEGIKILNIKYKIGLNLPELTSMDSKTVVSG